jgi:hypothetical protein
LEKNIFNLISKLDIYTQNRLKKWLQSPIHNQDTKLFLLLETFLAQEKKKKTAKDTLQMQKNVANYDNASELAKRVREFLAYEHWQQNAVQTNFALAENLYHLDIATHTADALKRTADALEKQPHRNADWHFLYYQMLGLREMTQQNEVRKTGNTYVLDIANHLDIAYFVKRLILYADIISYNNVLKLNLKNEGYDALFAYISALGMLHEPLIALHIALINCLIDEGNEAHFYTLKILLTEHYTLLNAYERRDRSMVAINYCVRRINKGHLNYYKELFDLYLVLLNNKVLLENNILQYWDYKNIISVGLQVKEYDWISNFLYEYNEKIPANWRENALTYNLAKLNFAQKNYAKVIELLQIVEYQDIVYTLDSRTMLLKTYYATNEFDAFDAAAESFRIFLLRNKTISIGMKKMYQNFLRFIKILSTMQLKDTKAARKLHEDITKCEAVSDKKWLLEHTLCS